MTIGQLMIYLIFMLDIIVFGIYLASIGNDSVLKTARKGSWLIFIISGIATFYLAGLFLNDQFMFEYVRGHSATTMAPIYKLTALWAGQDGTFLLWLFFLAGTSLILTYTMKEYESWTLLYMKGLEMLLCVMLFYKNPFAATEAGIDITQGMGLNPLLQNFWMVSHPPIMFLGYAAAAAPFAIFLAGVSMGEPVKWMKRARPWAICSWLTMGIGIYLGMYWSYEVLGWGGYWAWDPVENASLFSWVILGGAVHGMLLQSYRRSYALWNGVMVATGYVMVIFSTFLTRSGVLADVSLHSFPGLELYVPLMLTMIIISSLGAGLIVRQAILLSKEKQEETTGARPLFLTWAVYIFAVFFIFVIIGTVHPLIESMMGKKPSPVQPYYYNATSFIPGIPAAILLFLTPMIFTRKKGAAFPLIPTIAGVAAAIAVAAACVMAGIKHPAHIALASFSAAATVTSCIYFVTLLRNKNKSYASYLTHIGIAVMLLGFIPSSMGSKSIRAIMSPGETIDSPGGKVTLNSVESIEHGDRAAISIQTKSGKRDFTLDFVSHESERMKINKPYIVRGALGDVYIAPIQAARDTEAEQENANVLVLEKTKPSDIGGGIELTFTSFDLTKMQSGLVGIVIKAVYDDTTEEFTLDYGSTAEGSVKSRTKLQGRNVELMATGIDASRGIVRLEKTDLDTAPAPGPAISEPSVTAVFQVSTKPWIALVWLGMVLISIGSIIAMARRFKA